MRSIDNYQIEFSGLENRLAQMFNPDTGRCVMLAVDHGYFQGAPKGLENLRKTIEPLLPYCDAFSPTIGGLKTSVSSKIRTPIILRATGGNSMARTKEVVKTDPETGEELKDSTGKPITEEVPVDLEDEIVTVSVDTIIRLNCIGFTASAYVGSAFQKQTIGNLTSLTNEAHEKGLIAVGITAVGKDYEEIVKGESKKGVPLTPEKKKAALRYLRHAARVLSENGADIVKTYYCEEFEKVVNSCLAPIVIAGGKKLPTQEALDMTYKAIQAGAIGVDMGRNIFQNEDPIAMIKAIRKIVHEEATAELAYEFYQQLSKSKKE